MKRHNRRYKDSVFADLFGEDKNAKKNFLALYNTLYAANYHSTSRIIKSLNDLIHFGIVYPCNMMRYPVCTLGVIPVK